MPRSVLSRATDAVANRLDRRSFLAPTELAQPDVFSDDISHLHREVAEPATSTAGMFRTGIPYELQNGRTDPPPIGADRASIEAQGEEFAETAR